MSDVSGQGMALSSHSAPVDTEIVGRVPFLFAVVGQRGALNAEELPRTKSAIHKVFDVFTNHLPNTPLQLLTTLDSDLERLVVREALSSGITVLAILPMPRQRFVAALENEKERFALVELLDQCRSTYTLPEEQRAKDPHATCEHQQRHLLAKGVMVRHAMALIALWDGSPATCPLDCGNLAQFALTGHGWGLPEGLITPQHLLEPPPTIPLFHVVLPKTPESGKTVQSLPIHLRFSRQWLGTKGKAESDQEALSLITGKWLRLEELNCDIGALFPNVKEAFKGADYTLLPEKERESLGFKFKNLEQIFFTVDRSAIHFQKQYVLGIKINYLFAGLMMLSMIFYLRLSPAVTALLTYLTFFTLSIALFWIKGRRELHNRYLEYRSLAEGIRVQFFRHLVGAAARKDRQEACTVGQRYLRKQKSEVTWVRVAMETLFLPGDETVSLSARERLAMVKEHWIGDQARYFRKAALRDQHRLQHFKRVSLGLLLSSWLVTVVIIVVLLVPIPLSDLIMRILAFSMAALAGLAGVFSAYPKTMAFDQQAKQYERMSELFSQAENIFPQLDEEKARQMVETLSGEALQENGDWLLLQRERSLPKPMVMHFFKSMKSPATKRKAPWK